MKKFKFNIKGMHCQSCSRLIESELKGRKGILMSKIDMDSGRTVVVYDEGDVTEAEIKRLVEKAGDYKVEESDKNGEEEEEDDKSGANSAPIGKKNFLFGFVTGVAVISLIGFFVMAGMYLNKNSSAGAPLKAAKDTIADTADNAKIDNNKQPPLPAPADKVDIEVKDSDHIRGNKNAPITIIEFSDLQCPFCSRFHDTMKQVTAAYPNDVRWIYKHFPLSSIHPYAQKAALASECASEQGKFWEYVDNIFDNQSSLNNDYLATAAKNVGLNTKKFDECLSAGKYASQVSSDYSQGQQAGVTGTPANFINGQLVAGAVPFETIKQKIESLK